MPEPTNQSIELSIIIKTLNEERNIARCIEAAIKATRNISTEIIVADSGSSDRTLEISKNCAVRVVQLSNFAERCCGIGPQLGYQHSRGNFVLILDADMVLHAPFVKAALARMEADTCCAGIGGQLVEKSGIGYEYELRNAMTTENDVEVKWLDGGGLYRRAAIDAVGYLSNRNLHAYEEKELGLRLRHAGWHMYRLGVVAVDHYGHAVNTVNLLWRRWRSGYADACGESLRACVGKPYFWEMLAVHKAIAISLVMQIAVFLSISALPISKFAFPTTVLMLASAFIVQVIRKKSARNALHSVMHLNVFAVGMVRGIFKKSRNPHALIASNVW